MSALPDSRHRLGGCILAGGRATRMGGLDKGLARYHGMPLILHVVQRLSPQVGAIVVSANRNLEIYAALGYTTVADQLPGFLGPLAGMHAALTAFGASVDAMLTVPCDAPHLPDLLATRLLAAAAPTQAAVATLSGRKEPVFALLRPGHRAAIEAFLAQGERKMERFLAAIGAAEVPFDDRPDDFVNFNSLDALDRANAHPVRVA